MSEDTFATSPRRRSKSGFSSRKARSLKVKGILKDIDEARDFGIELHNDLSLNELYSYLRDARKKRREFESKHPNKSFVYDQNESQQQAYDDDGLDELKRRFVKDARKRTLLRKQRSRSRSKGKRRR